MSYLTEIASKYGLFVIGGAFGAVVNRLRTKMTLKKFFMSIFISMFVALCTGVVARDYFHLAQDIVYVLCGISGVFSEVILDEVQETIKNVSNLISARFGSKDNFEE